MYNTHMRRINLPFLITGCALLASWILFFVFVVGVHDELKISNKFTVKYDCRIVDKLPNTPLEVRGRCHDLMQKQQGL